MKTARSWPSLSLKSQATGTRSTTRLGLHRSSDVTFGGRGSKIKTRQIKKIWHLAEIAKFNAHQILPLYSIFPTYRGRGFPTYPSRVGGGTPQGIGGSPSTHGRGCSTYPGRGVPTYTGSG